MRLFDYDGNGDDGSTLEHGKIYMASATGAPDENGVLREDKDKNPREYRAVKNGRLFSMWPEDTIGGYVLPLYMEFADE